jgi:hypothetical protein
MIMKATFDKICPYCGKPFTAKRADKMYCNATCRQMAYFKRNGLPLSGVKPKNAQRVDPDPYTGDLPETYTYVKSRFEKLICKAFLEDDNSEKLEDPRKYWSTQTMLSIAWVNPRLRCLLESVIRLSNYATIDQHTLDCVKDALNRMQQSRTFKSLPDDYPFLEIISELALIIRKEPVMKRRDNLVRFRIPLEQKTRLIYARHVLQKITPPLKFSELHFNE